MWVSVATNWRRSVASYGGIAGTYVKLGLALRLDFLVGFGATILITLVLLSIWGLIHAQSDQVQANFTAAQLATYIVIAQVVNLARMGQATASVVYRTMRNVETGQIAMDLVRPLNIQVLRYAEWAGLFAFDAVLIALPTWLIFRLTGIAEGPATLGDGLLFLLSLMLGWVVMAGLQTILNTLTMQTLQGSGLVKARVAVQELMSGALIPLAAMPDALRVAAEILPFQAVVSTPALFYLGNLHGVDAARALAVQAVWAIALIVAGQLLWRRMAWRIQIQGG